MLLIAEIGAVADAYSALSSERPYRADLTPDVTISTLRDMAGPHLHPEIGEALGRLVPSYPVGHWVEVAGGAWAGWRGVVTGFPYRELHCLVPDHDPTERRAGASTDRVTSVA